MAFHDEVPASYTSKYTLAMAAFVVGSRNYIADFPNGSDNNAIYYRGSATGLTLYCTIQNSTNQYWDFTETANLVAGFYKVNIALGNANSDPLIATLFGYFNGTTFDLNAASTPSTTVPTAAQVATAVWQDSTAGDFTVAGSIGKSLYTTGNAPGAASGLAIVGSAMTLAANQHVIVDSGTVTTVSGNVSGSVGSVVGAVGSVTGNVGGNVAGSVGSINGISFPTRFSSLAIDTSGFVTFNNSAIAVSGNVTLAAAQPNYAPAKAGDVRINVQLTGVSG